MLKTYFPKFTSKEKSGGDSVYSRIESIERALSSKQWDEMSSDSIGELLLAFVLITKSRFIDFKLIQKRNEYQCWLHMSGIWILKSAF